MHVDYDQNAVENGIQIWGDNVTAYGVAAEHSLGDQVVWMGEGGEAWFFQSELPYGVNQTDYADKGTTGYRVGPDVKTHSANGVGAYTYFRDYKVTVKSGFVVPDTPAGANRLESQSSCCTRQRAIPSHSRPRQVRSFGVSCLSRRTT